MKRLIIILVVFFFSGTLKASNKIEVKIMTKNSATMKTKMDLNFKVNTLYKNLKGHVFQTQVVTTFTYDCGITWQVTTTCSCSVKDAYTAQGTWIQSHMGDNGCLHPGYTEV